MCGRFFVDAKNREIDRLLASLPDNGASPQLGEIAPSQNALALGRDAGKDQALVMKWGFPMRASKGLIFNARSETALTKPMFAKALKQNPLAIPANGFYEWKVIPERKQKVKYFFTAPDDILWLAAFWNTFQNSDGKPERSFTILTTRSNPSVLPWHDRMPVLLRKDQIAPWLEGENLSDVLASEPFTLHAEICN